MALSIGLHYGVDATTYHNDPSGKTALSSSIATTLVNETPAHAYLRHPRLGGEPREATKEMDHGTLVHALLLGAGKEIVEVKENDWRKDVAKEARDEARKLDKIACLTKDIERAREAVDVINAKFKKRGIILDGASEVVAIWEEALPDGRKVTCRAMMDHLILSRGKIYDLKTTVSANPSKLEPKMTDFGYDVQSHVYERALGTIHPELFGRIDVEFLFCEVEAPFCVTTVACDGELQDLGRRRWRRALHTWADCLERDHWPEYASHVVRLGPKPWAVVTEDTHGFVANY